MAIMRMAGTIWLSKYLWCRILPTPNWQERGLLPDDLRVKVVCPLHQALYYAHANNFAISDFKPDSVRYRADGQPVFIDHVLSNTENVLLFDC